MRSFAQAVVCLLAVVVPAAPAWAGRAVPKPKTKARAASVACPDAVMQPAPGTGSRYDAATRCLINRARTASGLRPLRGEIRLAVAATAFAQDMVARRFFAHVAPEGTTARARIRATGYRGRTGRFRSGETIGWGAGEYATPFSIVSEWLHSDEHRAILLSPRLPRGRHRAGARRARDRRGRRDGRRRLRRPALGPLRPRPRPAPRSSGRGRRCRASRSRTGRPGGRARRASRPARGRCPGTARAAQRRARALR